MRRASIPLLLLWLLPACGGSGGGPEAPDHPSLVLLPEHKALILERIDREPYATLMQRIRDRAASEWRVPSDEYWDHDAIGNNAMIALSNAILAWLEDDAAAAERTLEFFDGLPTNFEDHENWDVNIRMPRVLIGACDAWDVLAATPYFPEADRIAARDKIIEITGKFYDGYVLDDTIRMLSLGFSQNNHPIRTATAIGYPALLFPDHPQAPVWLNWAVSELDYLWGPKGQYVQADGGVSEGPHYYGFALGPTIAFFIAVENATSPEREYRRNCINRRDVDPWIGHGCVDGERFVFENPLRTQRFHDTLAWAISLRMPNGYLPPLADAAFRTINGQAVMAAFGGPAFFRWDWETNARAFATGHYYELTPHHLAYFDDSLPAEEPPFSYRFMPDAGNAIFRSGWGPDDLWLLLVAEHGSARKTLHDHVDGTSFTLAAFGDYLVIDTGYYKPNDLDNARTADADAHNVILIDGQGAPDKGLLNDFGDADAFLENGLDAEAFDYAEARQSYQDTQIVRAVVFARDRYVVVADRLASDRIDPREYRWRIHANAGLDLGHTFELRADGAYWEREAGGLAVHLAATAPGLSYLEPPLVEGYAPHVHEFDYERNLGHHGVVDGTITAAAPDFLAVLAPQRVSASAGDPDGPLQVTPVTAAEGQAAWLVAGPAGDDLIFLREEGAPESLDLPGGQRVETDAALVVFGLDDGAVLVARGTQVTLDGQVVASVAAADGVEVQE